jgi:transcriptional regulator with XRE-family HTH domain
VEPSGIGKRIKFYRLQRGLTQMELADHVGVSYQQIQKYENEKSQVTLQRLVAIARALDTPLAAIFPGPAVARLSERAGRPAPASPRDERIFLELFSRIKSPQLKRTVLLLVRSIVDHQG